MKLFLWLNQNSKSDLTYEYTENFFAHDSSNAHSGGAVVLAENENEAFELLKKANQGVDMRDEKIEESKPIEIPFDKKGVVIFCDGDCD